jgi:hypothetical protein
MFSEVLDSSIVELLHEETNPAGDSHKLLLRVKDKEAWGQCILSILSKQGEVFGASVRKEYYIKEGTPSFVWVILLWGNLAEAVEEIISCLTPPPKKPSAPPKVVPRTKVTKKTYRGEDGTQRTVVSIPLPHFRRNKGIDPNKIQKLGSRSFGATVTSLQESGGL